MTEAELFALPFDEYITKRREKRDKSKLMKSITKNHIEITLTIEALWTKRYYTNLIQQNR